MTQYKADMLNLLNYIPMRLPAPTVRMHRISNNERYCISRLYDGKSGQWICDAIEDTVRDTDHNGYIDHGEEKMYGETAIPCGRYYVTFAKTSLDIGKKARYGCIPLLHKVDSFTHIRIHPGETEKNSEGCILLGYNEEAGRLADSETVCLSFYERMNYSPFWLVITDDFAFGASQGHKKTDY